MKNLLILFFALISVANPVQADDFFSVKRIEYYSTKPGHLGVFHFDRSNLASIFVPCIEAQIAVKEPVKSQNVFAKAYFYDQDKKLIATVDKPAVAIHEDGQVYDWLGIIPSHKQQSIFFALPNQVLQQDGWSAVIIFGDNKGVDAHVYPISADLTEYDYEEKRILEDKSGPPIDRASTMDPLIEHVVQTDNPSYSQITLFLRPPPGMTDASQAKGVLCMCVVADSVAELKNELQGDIVHDVILGRLLQFAQNHQLIIICWGSHRVWDLGKNWDEMNPDAAKEADRTFDQISTAWARGIQYFVDQYKIPQRNYLLWGISGAGQYACRLALHKPEYFLAVHAHIPSSFDKPTPEANKVLWCLTTGELEPGYQRSLRFYTQCRELGYPIIYKAIMGLGHGVSPIADQIGLSFFEYALSVRDQRLVLDQSLVDSLAQNQPAASPQPWLETFRQPPYVGDAVNQEMYPFDQQSNIPVGYRVPLPTKAIADAWNH